MTDFHNLLVGKVLINRRIQQKIDWVRRLSGPSSGFLPGFPTSALAVLYFLRVISLFPLNNFQKRLSRLVSYSNTWFWENSVMLSCIYLLVIAWLLKTFCQLLSPHPGWQMFAPIGKGKKVAEIRLNPPYPPDYDQFSFPEIFCNNCIASTHLLLPFSLSSKQSSIKLSIWAD